MRGEIFTFDDMAKEIREKYDISDQYPLKVVSLANAMGLKVLNAEFKDPNIAGAISKRDNPPAIYVNIQDNFIRQRFTVAHEIAHFYLHMNDNVPEIIDMYRGGVYSNEEYEANMLAAALLMGAENVRYEYEKLIKNEDMIKVKKYYGDQVYEESICAKLAAFFGVSKLSMRIRLNNLGLIRSV